VSIAAENPINFHQYHSYRTLLFIEIIPANR